MLKAIWAEDAVGGIGAGNQLLWHLPGDLNRFKQLTEGSSVVMGRATWDSLPFKPLPRRDNVVLTRDISVFGSGFPGIPVSTVEEVLEKFPESWVIGGGQIYSLFLPYVNEIRKTVVDQVFSEADTFAPSIFEEFYLVDDSVEYHHENGLDFRYETWLRKQI